MSLTNRLAVVLCLASCPSSLTGCSRPAPETIEGKTPAEYREEAEKRIARPISGAAAGPSQSKPK